MLVEIALVHTKKDPNGTACRRFEYIDDRSELMQKLAGYLDVLRKGRDRAEFKADAKDIVDPKSQLQALIAELGEDKVLGLLTSKVSG